MACILQITPAFMDLIYGLRFKKSLIRPSNKLFWLYNGLKDLGIPPEIINRIDYIEIPPKEMIHPYNIFLQLPKNRKDIPLADITLAWLSQKLNIPIISFDKHLNSILKRFINFRTLKVEWLDNTDIIDHVLVDTNILYPLTRSEDDWRKEEILAMLSRKKNLRLILCSKIYRELRYLVEKKRKHEISVLNPTLNSCENETPTNTVNHIEYNTDETELAIYSELSNILPAE